MKPKRFPLILLSSLVLSSGNLGAEQCHTFNLKFKACFDDWVSRDIVEGISQGLENNNLRGNFDFKKRARGDTVIFTVSTRSNENIEFVSRLPYEMKQEMPRTIGATYTHMLGGLASDYITVRWKELRKMTDSSKFEATEKAFIKRLRMEFHFDLKNNEGKLAKSYDITEFVAFTRYLAESRREIEGAEVHGDTGAIQAQEGASPDKQN
jgi:hypothetical protein